MMWIFLKKQEACTPCSRYAHTAALLERVPSAAFDRLLERANVQLDGLAQRVAKTVGSKRLVGLNLNLASCPSCKRSWVRPAAVVMQGSRAVALRLDNAYPLTPAQTAALRLAAPRKVA
jgi:hypothetical protein